jgi:hypothetical protein
MKNEKHKEREMPPYYHIVTIYFKGHRGKMVKKQAWLSWSERYGYIWTLCGTDIVILDKDVIKIM